MRLLPVITALLVVIVLYAVVFERDRVLGVAGVEAAPEPVSDTAAAPSPAADDEERVVSVVALKSAAQPIDNAVQLRGRTEAARQVNVTSETTGLVNSEPLRKGAYVEAGQALCSLDPGTKQASLNEARARLAEADINERAATKLAEDGYASETRAISARAGLQAAQAGVERAEREIAELHITAPFAGLLESDTAELGSLLQPGALCANIIQLDPIKLVGFVPETLVSKVKVGARAGARLSGGQEVIGRVTFLSRSADPETRTFRTEVEVPNPDLSIGDGQTVDMLIAAEGSDAHLLPSSALTLDDDGRLGVRIVGDESRAKFQEVTLIRDTATGVWLSGLPALAEVIVVGQDYVVDGVKIAVTYREANP